MSIHSGAESGNVSGSASASSPERMKTRQERDVRFKEPVVEPDTEGSESDGEEREDDGSASYGAGEAKVMRESSERAAQTRAVEGTQSSSWADLDLSIMIALVAPIGNWLTGTDHLKNLFLICLLIFYLHQIIEVPWQLYQSAVPRKLPPGIKLPPETDESQSHIIELARSELRRHEFLYLGLSLASPFIGAYLLRHGLSALSTEGDSPALSWFSITLFMFAVGIRPWSHLIKRLRARTHDLHDTVHYHHLSESLQNGLEAESKIKDLSDHVLKLEVELSKLRAATDDSKVALEDEHDDLSDSVKDLKMSLKKHERKSDTVKTSHDRRLQAVENTLGFVLEHLKRQEQLQSEDVWNKSLASASGFVQSHPFFHYFASTLFYIPNRLLSVITPGSIHIPSSPLDGDNGFVNITHSPSNNSKSHVSQIPGLDTITEDSDDESTLSPPSGEGSMDKSKRSRSRSRDRRRRATNRQGSTSVVRDLALQAVTLPYRAAERVLVIATSPIQKHLM